MNLSDNTVGFEGAVGLANMLDKNKCLRELDLTDNSIDEEGAQKLVASLREEKLLYLPAKYKSCFYSEKNCKYKQIVKSCVRFIGDLV